MRIAGEFGFAVFLVAFAATAQTPVFEQRGFLESQNFFFPQTTPNDSARGLDQTLLQWDTSYRPTPWLRFSGSFDARVDAHRQVDRQATPSLDDRRIQRPALDVRLLSAQVHKGFVTLEVGRQTIRWGQTDSVIPTDRFTPRDYVTDVTASDLIAVNAVRATFTRGNDSLDLVWQPWFTPSRTPLLNQRWSPVPAKVDGLQILDAGARYPGGSQEGARWNHVGTQSEYSLSYFQGRSSLPIFDTHADPVAATLDIQRRYATMRMYGGDVSHQFAWATLKCEAGYFESSTLGAQDYVLYVCQVERHLQDWVLICGYSGSAITAGPANPLQFSPDLGLSRSFVGRASRAIDVNRSVSVEAAVRSGGSFVRAEYFQAIGSHWRIAPAATWLRGAPSDFIGQYRKNSSLSVNLRYSF